MQMNALERSSFLSRQMINADITTIFQHQNEILRVGGTPVVSVVWCKVIKVSPSQSEKRFPKLRYRAPCSNHRTCALIALKKKEWH